jgi:glucuronokinase
MRFWAQLTDDFRAALDAGDIPEMNRIIDANFDKRASLCQLAPGLVKMVETARSCGASAKFTGSGGAIVGVCPDDATFARLETELAKLKVKVFRPHPAPAEP